jgi:two-component system sensor histidine kinase UhpB
MNPEFSEIILNNQSDLCLVCSLNYGKTLGNFILANNTASKKLGYKKSELLQMNFLSLCNKNFEREIVSIIDKLIDQGEINFDVQLLTRENMKLLIEFNAIIIEDDGKQLVILSGREPVGRKRMEEKLIQTMEQLRNLSSHLQSVREEERTNIAREIHDELGQVLTVLKIQVTLLSKELRKDQYNLRERMESVARLLEETVESVQRITSELRPGILDELGLVPAIEWQAQEFNNRTNIDVECDLPKEEIIMDQSKATAVFRIFQEALTNIARHANASKIKIVLEQMDGKLKLKITDNGKGITQNQINNTKSLGILGMKERALVFGGTVTIKSTMDIGSVVELGIPLT